MKKIAYFLSLILLLSAVAPAAMANDGKEKPENGALSPEEKARLDQLDNRFLEIKAMDFESMDRSERKEVRKELREINKEAKELGGGVYISTGAIIIILLLILIL